MVTKPWSERTKTTQQLLMESMGPLSQIPGIRVIPMTPPPLPGGGDFPVDLVIASAAEPQQLGELAGQLVQKAFASGLFIFADADLKFDQPQAEVVFDRDKLRSQGVELQPGRLGSVDAARRELRQPVQHPGAQLQGHSAGQAGGAADSRSADADLRHRLERQAGAAVDVRQPADDGRATGAEEIPAAQCRAHPGRDPAAGAARSGADASSRTRRGRSCRRASPSTTPASRASSGRRAAGSSARSCSRRS